MRIRSQLKKGSAEVLILSLLEDGPRHGYELGKLIERHSDGVLHFTVAGLYPTLYRLEKRGWIKGQWEHAGAGRRRRFYRLTVKGAGVLRAQRSEWRAFIGALSRIARIRHA